jgi:hypothetical protein
MSAHFSDMGKAILKPVRWGQASPISIIMRSYTARLTLNNIPLFHFIKKTKY